MGVVSQVRPPPPIKREPSPLPEWEDTCDVEGAGVECAGVEDVGCDGVVETEGGAKDVAMVKEEIEEVKDKKMAIDVYVYYSIMCL